MSRSSFDGAALVVAMMLAATVIAIAEFAAAGGGRGALLFTLVVWVAIAEGSVAAVAAAEITGARWVEPLRGELLAAARLLPFLAGLFVLLWPQLGLYPWSAAPGEWLNRPFFFGRNLALLVAAAFLARRFADRALRRSASAGRCAIVYLVVYVASQTLVAFDLVMSLAYPWVSSMFGLYFLMEGLYAGVAVAGILFLLLRGVGPVRGPERWHRAARDAGLLLFGFSVLWGGLFFAQFLLIWYGNLPEEVSFITARVAAEETRRLVPAFIALCWALPFFLLISSWAKRSAWATGIAAASVLLGIAAERALFVQPILRLPAATVVVENLVLVAVWWGAVAVARAGTGAAADPRGGVA